MTAAETSDRRPGDWIELGMKKGLGLVIVLLGAALMALIATLYIVANLY